MSKLISANFSRLFRSVIFWLCMLFEFGFAVFAVGTRFRDLLMAPEYAFHTADGLCFASGIYFGIIVAVFTGIWVGTDYSDGTIRNKLAVGHTRGEIYGANWVVCVSAALMMHVVYIVTIAGLGCLLLEPFETPVRTLVLCSLASIVTVAAMSSLFLLLAMLIHSKSTGVVVAMLTALALTMGGVMVYSKLQAPEYIESNYVMNEEGQLVQGEPIPNPNYLRGTKRKVYEFLMDFQPCSQMMEYAFSEEPPKNLAVLPVYSLIVTVGTSLGGWYFFRRKDLK